jgi:hypothetical protein
MPAKSKAVQIAAAIALHHPSKLKKKNRGLLKMSKEQLRHYAETPHKGLPEHVNDLKKRGRLKSKKGKR